MKNIFKATNLPALIMGTGGLGLLLRVWLMSSGIDDKGFLVGSHPAHILLWLLVAVVLVMLLLLTKDLVAAPNYDFNFPKSTTSSRGIPFSGALFKTSCFCTPSYIVFGKALSRPLVSRMAVSISDISGYPRPRNSSIRSSTV